MAGTTWPPTQRAREREATMQPHHFYSIRRPIGTKRDIERERKREREREIELEARRKVAETTWPPTQRAREREATMQPPHFYSIRRPTGTERERERERPRG